MILSAFEKGLTEGGATEVNRVVLCRERSPAALLETFRHADAVILAYPLYTDAMPALVMEFIEALIPLIGTCNGKPLGFIVQSGFPEACQSRAAERYNEKLSRRLGCAYAGTAIKGDCNRMELQPKFMTKPVFTAFEQLGNVFATDRKFDERMIRKLAAPERLGAFTRTLIQVLDAVTPLTKLYWNRELRKNNAFAERNARPYADSA
jgi:hypothetical protein